MSNLVSVVVSQNNLYEEEAWGVGMLLVNKVVVACMEGIKRRPHLRV